MADKCGNCDCADKTQCVKKGDSYGVVIVDTEKRYRVLFHFIHPPVRLVAS
uniref:Uncharacterized protein n=1 Tax=Triticum aestivum TaxID=4565 RepID=A0A077RXU5_WHEAT|nr:unnamed protein product [Triticum aestivum]